MYLEFTLSQAMDQFLSCHQHAFQFFGGIPERIMIDNLKTGVLEHPLGEKALFHPRYLDFAAHYGTAILSARPAKPRDKAKIEAGVLVAERWILARLRHETFFSLAALNARIAELLTDQGHDAVWVDAAVGRGTADRDLLERAAAERRCLVTENFADFALLFDERSRRGDDCVPVVFVRKSSFDRRGGAIAARIAQRLHEWAEANPEPYVGLHWP